MRLLFFTVILTVTAAAFAQPADVTRTLRTFDFEERRLGNAEDLPMNWVKIEGSGFPHYTNARLSTDWAHSGGYSFRFDLNGGSLLYRYPSGRIPVTADAHYRVQAMVRTTQLKHARARVSAFFTDIDHRPIKETVRHSDLFAAADPSQPWRQLHIEITAPQNARFLVIELGLLQPAQYAPPDLGKRTLYNQDVFGTAWFDDVAVSQVPQVHVSTGKPGNIFRKSDELNLAVDVRDRFIDDLAGQLVITDALGKTVYQRSGAMESASTTTSNPGRKRLTLDLPSLPPGWYRASLALSSQGQSVGTQTCDLIVLNDDSRATIPDIRFGIVATHAPLSTWTELPDVLQTLGAGRVKLAIWGPQGDVQSLDSSMFDRVLESLSEKRIVPTAVLASPPPALSSEMNGSAWTQILSSPREVWQPRLAYLIARHANHLAHWQLGDDASDAFVTDPKMREVYQRIYDEFENLIQRPDLAMPWPAWYELDGRAPATIALHVRPEVLPSQIPLYISEYTSRSGGNLSVFLEPIDRDRYGRDAQIRDLAQRFIYALSAGATRIDFRLPATFETDSQHTTTQPHELLLVLRTMMTTLSGAEFRGRVPISEEVEAFLFDRQGKGILVMWERGSPDSNKDHAPLAVNFGKAPLRIDLWGNAQPLLRTLQNDREGIVKFDVGDMPIFIVDVDAQLMEFRASVAIDNDRIESSFRPHTRIIRFRNPYRTAITGSLRLSPPQGWTISPPSLNFSLNPGEEFVREISLEFPYNSFAGNKIINAEFELQADGTSRFAVPIVLKLGLSDVGLQTLALRDGRDLVVQQLITNYGNKPIDYTAFVTYPGSARQERIVTGLAPGRTTIRKYRFVNVQFAPNATVRSGVKELDGVRILNEEVEIR
jgi:hypothetical protein